MHTHTPCENHQGWQGIYIIYTNTYTNLCTLKHTHTYTNDHLLTCICAQIHNETISHFILSTIWKKVLFLFLILTMRWRLRTKNKKFDSQCLCIWQVNVCVSDIKLRWQLYELIMCASLYYKIAMLDQWMSMK